MFFLFLTAFGATSTTTAAAPATTGFLFGSSATPAAGTAAPSSLNSTFTFGNPTASASTAHQLHHNHLHLVLVYKIQQLFVHLVVQLHLVVHQHQQHQLLEQLVRKQLK